MQYSRLGNSGLLVSRLAFGAMTFGRGGGIFASVSKVDADLADQMVNKAIDAGINHFNSANGYTGGQSEQILGKALASRRQDVVISTKCGMRTGPGLLQQGLSRNQILTQCEASLQRLGTDYIDIYLVHRTDAHTPIEETVAALDTLVQQGKIRYAGFSNWPAWMAAKAVGIANATGAAQFRAAELYYSLVGRDFEFDLEPFVRDAGIGVFVWSPLAGGFLTGKYTRDNPQGDGGRLTGFDMLPYDRAKAHDLLDHLRTLATAHNASVAQIALAWVLSKPAVSSVLIGANKMTQLDDNLAAIDVKLSAEELAKLDEMTATALPYPHWFAQRVQDPMAANALAGKPLK